jgi:hypothetical protein
MPAFDNKIFNAEVFGSYVDRIPRVKQNKLLEVGILKTRNDLKSMFSAQAGGNYATVPMYGLIDGDPQNYDGDTDFTPVSTKTYSQSMVVVGRMKAWTERDFSGDITSADFMDNVAQQLSAYWDDVDQATILSVLKGIFSMSANDFTTRHTTDISSDSVPNVGATTLNSAIQKASGDNKSIFKVAIAHSVVATNLENLSAINYLKYTDSKGVERDLGIATWNGRLVLIDDSVPVTTVNGTAGVYTLTPGSGATDGDKISFDGTEYTLTTASNATAVVTQLKTALASQYGATFTLSGTSTLIFTQAVKGTGACPTVSCNASNTTLTGASIATTTTGVASTIKYTTYLLGDGAFDFCDCGAKVPYEMDRDPKTNGGVDTLYTRQRKLFAPRGISFTKSSMSSNSPTAAELETGANWELVNDGAASNKSYINHKAIPIARIISQG